MPGPQRVHYSDEDPLALINASIEAAARADGWEPPAQARSPRPVRRSAARAMELMSRAASVTRDALSDHADGDGSGNSSPQNRRSSEPTSPTAPPASAGAAAFRLGGGMGEVQPAGARRLFAAGEGRIVLEGRPGSGAGQLIITAARHSRVGAAVGGGNAGTPQRRLPGSPAAMLAHWTIGSPSGENADQ